MKRIALTTIAALLVFSIVGVAGAAKYDEGTLVGTWEFDMVKMYKNAMEAAGQEMPPGMSIEALVKDSYMRLTFNADGTYSFATRAMGTESSEAGKWEVVEKGDNSVTVKSVDDKGEEQVVKMSFVDKDHMDAAVTNGEQEMIMSATRVTAMKEKDKEKEKKDE